MPGCEPGQQQEFTKKIQTPPNLPFPASAGKPKGEELNSLPFAKGGKGWV